MTIRIGLVRCILVCQRSAKGDKEGKQKKKSGLTVTYIYTVSPCVCFLFAVVWLSYVSYPFSGYSLCIVPFMGPKKKMEKGSRFPVSSSVMVVPESVLNSLK